MVNGKLTETVGRHKVKVEKRTWGGYGGGCENGHYSRQRVDEQRD